MPNKFSCFIPGDPVPKQRPRFTGHVYTHRRTREWEAIVGWTWKQKDGPLFEGPIAVTLDFLYPTARRVDVDNLAKACLDGLQGVAFADDSQIARLASSKRIDRMLPGVWVTIVEVE